MIFSLAKPGSACVPWSQNAIKKRTQIPYGILLQFNEILSFLDNDHAIPKPATTVERESFTASIKIRQVKKFIVTFRYQIIENLFKSKTCWQFRLSSKFRATLVATVAF